MKKLAELIARLKELKATGLLIVSAAETAGRDLTDDETEAFEVLEHDIAAVQGQIDQSQKLAEARRRMDAVDIGGVTVPGVTPYGHNATHDLDPALTGGFADMMEFAVTVREASRPGGTVDARLMAAPTSFHTGGGDAGEGFSLPAQYRDSVFEVMENSDEFGPIVDEESTSKRRVEYQANEETPWGATGVTASWRSEGAVMSPSKLADESRSIPLHEIYAFVLATGELLDDAPRMAGRLTKRAGQALAWKKNAAMMFGSGSGQPLGWHNSAALITVAKQGSQVADTIVDQNVLKMASRLAVIPGDTPIWLANRNTIPQLAAMTIGDQPVWLPPTGLKEAPGGFLLGYPVMFTEHAKTLGDSGDLQLISGQGYYSIVRDAGPVMASSIHLYFDYNVEAFRWMTRFGGQPHLSAAIDAPTAGGGSANSKSHFVTLADRA